MDFIATASTTLVPIPTAPSDPNFGRLRIKNDVLYPKGEQPYNGSDLQMRIALFIISQGVPIISAALLTFSRKGWWKSKYYWTMGRMAVFWLFSIQLFGAIVYFQKGATTRTLFLAATLHLQIEYMIIALLLKSSGLTALIVAYIGGTILYAIQLFVEDLSLVFILSTIGGFTDFLIPALCAYGRQWLYATAGFAHLAQAIAVFCIAVKNYGHYQFNVAIFITTWLMNGALVAAVYRTWKEGGAIRLKGGNGEGEPLEGQIVVEPRSLEATPAEEASDNPLRNVDIPKKMLYMIFGVAIVGSIISANVFVFVVARN